TFPLRDMDGNYRWFLSRAVPIRNSTGEIARWFGTNTDVTEQRAIELSLRETKDLLSNQASILEQLVSERTARLQDTINELEHFSYTIPHDMRAPLRAMQGFAGLLLADVGPSLPPHSADYLKRIAAAASRMDALIRDSLQYAKIVREKPPASAIQP